MTLFNAPFTPWIRRSLLLLGVVLAALAQTGCAYPYPGGVVHVRDHGYRHMPAPSWGYQGYQGYRGRGGRW
jgi:CBS-domain-containing membrane protein